MAANSWSHDGCGAGQAYLLAEFDKPEPIPLPEEAVPPGACRKRMSVKCLCGFERSGCCWNLQMEKRLLSRGWTAPPSDEGALYKRDSHGELIALLRVYTDDISATSKHKSVAVETVDDIAKTSGASRPAVSVRCSII